ncbi:MULTISPECIES: YeeE/YedE family protein [Deinococcus]|uniref:YeeE/YedE family protein n=1 Tax=Deinococcus TaxID=1298 RepID=UPI000A035CC1|nr:MULTISPECIES: YeeE/YedE family protein [Deinococcus]MCY1702355.1 YeeE/YedE family protein [Deinococcus sp. SL84]
MTRSTFPVSHTSSPQARHPERWAAAALLAGLAVLAGHFYGPDLQFRLGIGMALGYTLSRAALGFAGSVNRAYNTGSTRLMQALMGLFFLSALLTTGVMVAAGPTALDLWINPINGGLLLGGLLFGFGMTFSSCCASGVLTDLVTGPPRALVTLVFFSAGVFLGFPVQQKASLVTQSWLTTPTGAALDKGGVFLPDLFAWDGTGGYLGALLLTGALCLSVVWLSRQYQGRRERLGRLGYVPSERRQDELRQQRRREQAGAELRGGWLTEAGYQRLFVRPWTMAEGATVLAVLFFLLMAVTGSGWGASTPYGLWFGQALMALGVSPERLGEWTGLGAKPFLIPFFQHPITVQNIGITLGVVLFLLMSDRLRQVVRSALHLTPKEAGLYALGGLCMGVGTRLANGCNVGALFTPIANFSLSGWIFLVVMVIGGVAGNRFLRRMTP